MSFGGFFDNRLSLEGTVQPKLKRKVTTRNSQQHDVRRRIEYIHELKAQGLSQCDIELLLAELKD